MIPPYQPKKKQLLWRLKINWWNAVEYIICLLIEVLYLSSLMSAIKEFAKKKIFPSRLSHWNNIETVFLLLGRNHCWTLHAVCCYMWLTSWVPSLQMLSTVISGKFFHTVCCYMWSMSWVPSLQMLSTVISGKFFSYSMLLYVVNVLGTKFADAVNSDFR